jgi:hypothetical protein
MLSTLTHTTCFVAVTAIVTLTAHADQLTPDEVKFFETKIRPVLIKECYGCHSSKAGNVRGGLRLDTKELTLLGGSSGPAVVPGDLEESLIYNAITHEDFVMPPKRKLSADVIEDFRNWIEMGAPDPRETKVAQIQSTISAEDIETAKQNFWAYRRPVNHAAPQVQNQAWAKTDIDRFVLEKLEASKLSPADDAEAYKVLRRLCFDLVGLPPTPEQIKFFNRQWKEEPDQAIANVVDRLLEKDQFGERWGRHWLDVARYGESTGREVNMTYPHAWRYRDFVIDSFNADKPFDHFVRQQIAGDLMAAKTDDDWAENLVATTFLAIGPKNVNEQNRVQFDADLVDEQIDATSRVFLGMSVACARCHDHKFDAIPQTDYYAMAGIFANAKTYFGNPPSEYGNFRGLQARRQSSLLVMPVDDPNPFDKQYSSSELASLKQQIEQAIQAAAEARRNRNDPNAGAKRVRTANQLATLSSKLAVVDANGQPRSYCMGVQERDAPKDARLLVRGEIDQAAQTVPRGFPQVLCSAPANIDSRSSGRLELAKWIGSDDNTLTARVMANRIWQHMIGQGLVTSTENFGVTGQMPSHPELLDYLAADFVQSGWSVKSLIRQIANSRVYRISSQFNEDSHAYDPDNALLWRANPRRLDAEAIRDAMLSISGQIELDRPRASEVAKAGYTRVREGTLGDPRQKMRAAVEQAGKNVREQLRERYASNRRSQRGFRGRPAERAGREAMEAQIREVARKVQNQLDMEDAKFRSVYLPVVRDQEPRSLNVFDFADSNTVTGVRESSNTANQALYMMNNRFVVGQSEAFAKRVATDKRKTNDRLEYAFLLAYGRSPTSGERTATASFLKRFSPSANGSETIAALCQSLFASAEFRYID